MHQLPASRRTHSPGGLLISSLPFLGTCFSVPLWDRIHPIVLGLPFNFFWLITWLLLTPLCLWASYRLEVRYTAGSAP